MMADTSLAVRKPFGKACDRCKARKVRCTVDAGFEICNDCRRLGIECHFSPRKKPQRRTRLEIEEEWRRSACTSDSGQADSSTLQVVQPISQHSRPATPAPETPLSVSSHPAPSEEAPPPYSGGVANADLNLLGPHMPSQATPLPYGHEKIPRLYIDGLLSDPRASDRSLREQSNSQPQPNPDFVGMSPISAPTSLSDLASGTNLSLAFLSKRRILTLSARLGHDKLNLLVEAIESILSARMKSVDKVPQHSLVKETHGVASLTSGEHAFAYIRSYFEQVHPMYPFLDRQIFEARAFSPQLASDLAKDRNWTALYYAVLAIGCQYHDCGSFEPGKGQAWKFFEFTFSLCPDLLISKACLVTVQALTAMAIFARNISCIQLESITVSQAARMAQALGYNRATPTTDPSIQRTFWVLYCMEKTTCFYTGKTSLLNDHDIGCAPPSIPTPSMHGLDWLVTFSRYGRLVSQIYDNLFAINASGKSATAYYAIIDELSANLEAWRASIPEPFRPGAEFRARAFRGPPATTLAIFVQYLYYSVLLALSRATLHVAATNVEHAARHQEGKRLLMRTARSILELTKSIEVETYTPVWVLVFMPLSALFILFDFVVHNPVHPETNSNLALLDIAGGHFSHLEYVSHGTLPASLVAEFAHIARQYVQDFRLQHYQKTKGQATPATTIVAAPPEKAMETTTAKAAAPKTADEDPGQTLWPVSYAEERQSAPFQMNREDQSAASNGLLEYTDPLVFSLGDDSASALTDSGLGIDIMDLFDIELSDIWSLAA